MNCDICQNPIVLNKEEFVLDEKPDAKQPGVTLINFMAHKLCWDIQNPSFQYVNIPGFGGYNG